MPIWDWRDEGFMLEPKRVVVGHFYTLYRVWGGVSTEMGNPARPGVCFSLECPNTRKEAEALFSIAEWGNSCRYVTKFQVRPGAVVYVEKVHPGDFHGCEMGYPGTQVFIETRQVTLFVAKIGSARLLIDDLGSHVIVPNDDPGEYLSS